MPKVNVRCSALSLAFLLLACNNTQRGENGEIERPIPEEPGPPPTAPPPPAADQPPISAEEERAQLQVVEVVRTPSMWIDRTVTGTAMVESAPTERGFWIEEGGERLFVILVESPEGEPIDIVEGQTLHLHRATVRDAAFLDSIPGEMLEPQTRVLARAQPVYLVVYENDIEIIDQGMEDPDPGFP